MCMVRLPIMLTMFFVKLRKKLLMQCLKNFRHFVKMDIGKINMYYVSLISYRFCRISMIISMISIKKFKFMENYFDNIQFN